MRELPEGIDNNAEDLEDVYAGVEEKEVRSELKALAAICVNNEIISVAFSAVTGLEFERPSDMANYIFQNTDAKSSKKIAMYEIITLLNRSSKTGVLDALLS